jgi:hypothetical protein
MKLVWISAVALSLLGTSACKSRVFNESGDTESLVSGLTYKIDTSTVLKLRVANASELDAGEKCDIPKDTVLTLAAAPKDAEKSHVYVEVVKGLPSECESGALSNGKGYIFEGHILGNQKKVLSVPYFCQYESLHEPGVTCSNHSLAMAAAAHGITSLGLSGRLPDQIYEKWGKLNGVEKIAQAAKAMGFKAEFKKPGSMNLVKEQIDAGNPVVVGADFTGSVGHFVTIIGYDETGVYVNDPAGQWDQQTTSPNDGYGGKKCKWGYSGKGVHYSYRAMDRAAGSLGMYIVVLDK